MTDSTFGPHNLFTPSKRFGCCSRSTKPTAWLPASWQLQSARPARLSQACSTAPAHHPATPPWQASKLSFTPEN